jgi:hypothetical protein
VSCAGFPGLCTAELDTISCHKSQISNRIQSQLGQSPSLPAQLYVQRFIVLLWLRCSVFGFLWPKLAELCAGGTSCIDDSLVDCYGDVKLSAAAQRLPSATVAAAFISVSYYNSSYGAASSVTLRPHNICFYTQHCRTGLGLPALITFPRVCSIHGY